jgi:hypothetical protein
MGADGGAGRSFSNLIVRWRTVIFCKEEKAARLERWVWGSLHK